MPGDREIYPLEEIIEHFDPKRIGVSGAVFDINKLDWINQHYILNTIPVDQLWEKLKNWSFSDDFMQKLMPLVHTRIKTFGDFMKLCDFFFVNKLDYTPELFAVKDLQPEQICSILQGVIWHMEESENWGKEGIEQASYDVAKIFNLHHKKAVMPLLFASIMGKRQGLPLFASVDILGKDRTRARLLEAIHFLGGLPNKKLAQLRKEWDEKRKLF